MSLRPSFSLGSCVCSSCFQKYWASLDWVLCSWCLGKWPSVFWICDHLPIFHQWLSSCTRSNTFFSQKGNKEKILNKKLCGLDLEGSLWGSHHANSFLQPKIHRLEENYRDACWKARKRSWLLKSCCWPLLLMIRDRNTLSYTEGK